MSSEPLFEIRVRDFKPYMIEEKLSRAKCVIAFGSGKGGVGKSFIAALVSRALSDMGYRVGLLDLDLHSSSIPLILGLTKYEVESTKDGFEPLRLENLEVMSIRYFVGDRPVALRGRNKDEVILYLLALTNWSSRDFIVLDLPPGIGDEVLNAFNFLRKDRRVVVAITIPSTVSLIAVKNFIDVAKTLNVNVLGVIVNMSYIKADGKSVRLFESLDSRYIANFLGVDVLAELPLEPSAERYVGRLSECSTDLCCKIKKLSKNLAETLLA